MTADEIAAARATLGERMADKIRDAHAVALAAGIDRAAEVAEVIACERCFSGTPTRADLAQYDRFLSVLARNSRVGHWQYPQDRRLPHNDYEWHLPSREEWCALRSLACEVVEPRVYGPSAEMWLRRLGVR